MVMVVLGPGGGVVLVWRVVHLSPLQGGGVSVVQMVVSVVLVTGGLVSVLGGGVVVEDGGGGGVVELPGGGGGGGVEEGGGGGGGVLVGGGGGGQFGGSCFLTQFFLYPFALSFSGSGHSTSHLCKSESYFFKSFPSQVFFLSFP